MAGIYIHIPFCKQACYYCDFHFSTNLTRKGDLVNALTQELDLQADYLESEEISSIYFGGGTPSLLSPAELDQIMMRVYDLFDVRKDAEITLEANPDDLNEEMLGHFKNAQVNRLSIGVQSFDDDRLKFINRAHSSKEAIDALKMAKKAGYDNITADLIYAIPPDDIEYWKKDLQMMLDFDLPHLSIYGLTIEDQTVFGKWAKSGKLREVDEEVNARQYQLAIQLLTQHGYEHYEVSNFARPGHYSRHNSAYWEDRQYLGVGPGAHSYNGHSRSYNIRNNARYLDAIQKGELPNTTEVLSANDRANEYLFTHLRTRKGIDVRFFESDYGKDLLSDYSLEIQHYVAENLMIQEGNQLSLTSAGFLLADEISLRLFYDE